MRYAVAVLLALLAGCGTPEPTVIDGSSAESFERTTKQARREIPDADRLVLDGLRTTGRGWGRFDVRLSGAHPALRVVERMMSLRSRVTGIATGDQAIFARCDWFQRAGGFPEIPLMEDVALSKALRRIGPPLCLRRPVLTSSRRWEERGVLRTVVLMWRLRAAYALGADPARLAERYR